MTPLLGLAVLILALTVGLMCLGAIEAAINLAVDLMERRQQTNNEARPKPASHGRASYDHKIVR